MKLQIGLVLLIGLVNSGSGIDPVTVPITNATTPTPAPTTPTTLAKATPTTPVPTTPAPKIAECPPIVELDAAHCLCYPTMNYLICDGTSNTFTFKEQYEFKSLVIKNSPKLPFWNEHFVKSSNFKVERLVILQDTDVEITDNFNELLRLPDKALKIVSNGKIKSLDLGYLTKSLTSISINDIATVYHAYDTRDYFEDQRALQHIQFRNVQFNPPIVDLFLQSLPLTDIELINSGLEGKFGFVPNVCAKDNNRITIKLSGNALSDFNFDYLFPDKKNESNDCSYHIELSGNGQMRTDLLTSQVAILEKKAKKLFLVLNDLKLDCSCELYKLYKSTLSGYVHGVNCNTFGFMDQIEKDSKVEAQICPPPVTAAPPPKKP